MRATIVDLVAVLTAWVAWNPIDPAAAATTGVPWALKDREKRISGWLKTGYAPKSLYQPKAGPI